MKAIVTQKIATHDTTYGEVVGGKADGVIPAGITTEYLENVTMVREVTTEFGDVYELTHKTKNDVDYHATTYLKNQYNISVYGG